MFIFPSIVFGKTVYSVYVTHTWAELCTSAIHPFCKYAPENDRLSEQIYNKFSQLAMIDLGTYVTLMGKPIFVLLADEIQNRLVSSKNVAEYVLK